MPWQKSASFSADGSRPIGNAEKTRQTITAWNGMNGKQGGDPAKLAKALIELAGQAQPPLRWVAGADGVGALEQKARQLLEQAGAYRDLSSSLAVDDPINPPVVSEDR